MVNKSRKLRFFGLIGLVSLGGLILTFWFWQPPKNQTFQGFRTLGLPELPVLSPSPPLSAAATGKPAVLGEMIQNLPEIKPTIPIISSAPTLLPTVFSLASSPTHTPTLTHTPTPIHAPSSTPTPTPTPTSTSSPTPTLIFMPTLAPTSQPVGLQNSGFDQGLEFWQTRGSVAVNSTPIATQTQGDVAEELTDWPNFIRLASKTSRDWLGEHQLSQNFILPASHQTLEFWYRIGTEETALGFDDPTVILTINDQPLWWAGAAVAWEADLTAAPIAGIYQSNWRLIKVPLPLNLVSLVTQSELKLSFATGQTGDQNRGTWVELTGIRTTTEMTNPNYWLPTNLGESILKLTQNPAGWGFLTLPLDVDDSNLPNFSNYLAQAQTSDLAVTAEIWGVNLESQPTLQLAHWSSSWPASEPDFRIPTNLLKTGWVGFDFVPSSNFNQSLVEWLTLRNLLGQPLQLFSVAQ